MPTLATKTIFTLIYDVLKFIILNRHCICVNLIELWYLKRTNGIDCLGKKVMTAQLHLSK